MKRRRKVENIMILLKENILEQQEKIHHVKVECFMEILNMDEKPKAQEKHLDIMSQINLNIKSLQTKIEELDKRRIMEKSVPSSPPTIKAYDIRLHTLSTNECQ
jgi:hypothetical protein